MIDYAPLIRQRLVDVGWVAGKEGWIPSYLPEYHGEALLAAVVNVAGPIIDEKTAGVPPGTCRVTTIYERLCATLDLDPDMIVVGDDYDGPPSLLSWWEEQPERIGSDIDALLAATDLTFPE